MLEYKTVAGADSGIYLRGVPQIQIWDTTKEGGKWKIGADKGSGGLWNNGPAGTPGRDPLVKADKPFGQWNKFHITMSKNIVTVSLTTDWSLMKHLLLITGIERPPSRRRPLRDKGMKLQTHGGRYAGEIYTSRNCYQLCELNDEAGFVSVFNGIDFTGWKGLSQIMKLKMELFFTRQKGSTIYGEKGKDFQLS